MPRHMRTVVYPGTFDPITFGHLDVIERARKIFDRVIIGVAIETTKSPLFTAEERVSMIKEATKNMEKAVEVVAFEGLLVDFAKEHNATAVVRGLRAVSDFEFEFQMALMNRKLSEDFEVVFLMPRGAFTYLSSSIVKEIARLGGEVSSFVPPSVKAALEKRFKAAAGR